MRRWGKVSLALFLLISASACTNNHEKTQVDKSQPKTEKAKPAQPENADLKPVTFNVPKGVFYEVYVNSFYDSNGDGHGDLKGLAEKLDVLNDGNPKTKTDLGVDGLWLMPINPSPSYHKYDVTDYEAIDPTYGTIDDFEQLVKEAHERGMKVTMDFVTNHTSVEHSWFKQASLDPKSPYHDYYIWADKKTNLDVTGDWGQQLWYPNPNGEGYYYATFDRSMPDLNYDNPAVRRAIIEAGQFWLKKGVDGFRLDAAMYIYPGSTPDGAVKNLKWWTDFRKKMEEVNPHVILTGEVWTEASLIPPYFHSLHSTFDFPLSDMLVGSIAGGSDKGIAEQAESYNNAIKQYNTEARDSIFLSNHDENRVIDAFLGDMDKAKVAAALLLTLPGNPYIYYGEELGMSGSKPDEDIRSPYPWSDQQTKGEATWESLPQTVSYIKENQNPASLLNVYRNWIAIRHAHPALKEGDLKALDAGTDQVVAFERTGAGETLIVLHNITGRDAVVDLATKLANEAKVIASTAKNNTLQSGKVSLKPYSSLVIALK